MHKENLEILIATNNQFKIHEMRWYVADLPFVKVHNLSEINNVPEVEEDGETLAENANKKAVIISSLPETKDMVVFASDAGGHIPGLGDSWDYRRPKRNMGEFDSDEQRARNLIKMMEHLSGDDRMFHYPIALALAKRGELLWSIEFNSYTALVTDKPDFENIGKDRAMGRMLYLPEFSTTEDNLTTEQQELVRGRHQAEVKKDLVEFLQTLIK